MLAGACAIAAAPVTDTDRPITAKNWQGVGVQPDVVIDQAQALDKALALIAEKKAK